MNKLYLFLILAGLSLAGCHKVTVGYMKTDHAAYPIDSLQIFDTIEIKNEIDRLASASVSVYDSLTFVRDSLDEVVEAIYAGERFDLWEIGRDLKSELNELLADSLNHVGQIMELKEKIARNEAAIKVFDDQADALETVIQEIQDRLDTMDPSEIKTDGNVLKTLGELKLRVEKRVSWTTSEIEGVDGTAPIFYYVAGVRADEGGDAEVFRAELIIKGNGRFEVPYDFKAPTGRYHVSIRIENEGYSRILEDVFTFIVN